MARWLTVFLVAIVPSLGRADVISRLVEYRQGAASFEGAVLFDESGPSRRPGLLLAHEDGVGPLARQRAVQWARLGYVVFAMDLFGKSERPKSATEATRLAGLAGDDRIAIRERTLSALNTLKRQGIVDPGKLAAIGYGLGGTAVLELARSGADLEGVAAFHCDLTTPRLDHAKKIKAQILVVMGTDDPTVSIGQLSGFEQEMRGGGVDWQVLRIGGAARDFTNPRAGREPGSNTAYDAAADRRAAAAVRSFLEELFPRGSGGKGEAGHRIALPPGIPSKVATVLTRIDRTGDTFDGYEGGRTFGNFERHLPERDTSGRPVRYREWDVNPLRPDVNRGAERLVTGSDGSAYYTADHYKSFKKIR